MNSKKQNKSDVKYSESHHCSICKHFISPNSCEKVSGLIRPIDWCELWEKK